MTKLELLQQFRDSFEQYCKDHREFNRWFEPGEKRQQTPNKFVVYVSEPGVSEKAFDGNYSVKGGCIKWVFTPESTTKIKVSQSSLRFEDVEWMPKNDENSPQDNSFKFPEDDRKRNLIFERIRTFLSKFKFENAKNQDQSKAFELVNKTKINPGVWDIFRIQ